MSEPLKSLIEREFASIIEIQIDRVRCVTPPEAMEEFEQWASSLRICTKFPNSPEAWESHTHFHHALFDRIEVPHD